MSTPCVIVSSGGLPVVNTPNGLPLEVSSTGYGIPVTVVTDFGIAANLIGYSTGPGVAGNNFPILGFN